ncbi:dipeptidase PepV [Ligilactobacillus sp. LYQ139]|uniref:dipeptidase PepV n=1 Tax=Ligilactobacillus sp. LYQ139 TaxID=3378800 RepID=UPI003852080C
MGYDWQQAVTAHRDELLADLKAMLRIKSVRNERQATPDAPLGPGPQQALDHFLALGTRDGFKTKNVDGMAGHIEFGTGNETLGILGHVDVMPAGDGWSHAPFDPIIKDGKIYARGAMDDKGPSMAAYYGLKVVKESGLPVTKRVRFILGTDEESSWRGMKYYFAHMPAPDFGFSPDAEFPLINGEKGNVSLKLKFGGTNGGTVMLHQFTAGLRENMVPGNAKATVSGACLDEIEQAFSRFIKTAPVSGKATRTLDRLTLAVTGKAAHGMEPREGINAGTYLATFLKNYDFGGDAAHFITFIVNYLHEASRLEKFGAAFSDPVMGDLTMNAGLLNFTAGQTGSITLNFRYPQGIEPATIRTAIDRVTSQWDAVISVGEAMAPHYVALDDPLVTTLLGVYHRQTGTDAPAEVVGGGTYGRLMKRGVAFGALFPDCPNMMHQVDEYMPVEDIMKAAAIYAESIYELIK